MLEIDAFVGHLESGPRVLLLGQRLFGSDDKDNILFRASGLATEPNVYDQCLGEHAIDVRARLDHSGNTVPIDDDLDLFRRFPWRCVYTSAIDPIPYRLFHDSTRRPVTSAFASRQPDATSLILYRLFGATGRQTAAELPPSSRSELNNRRTSNVELIGQLPQSVGPTGRLFVAGWHPGKNDWLRPRDLGTSLNRLTRGQILIFGLDEQDKSALETDDDFRTLLEDGKAILFPSSLPRLLLEAEKKGITVLDPALVAPDTVTVSVGRHTPTKANIRHLTDLGPLIPVRFSVQEYKRLTETLSIPGDFQQQETEPETDEEIARAFLAFLSRDPVSHLRDCDRFAFRRPVFEREVAETVFDLLDKPAPQEHTVVLMGQSGAGKSIMIALLALWLRRAGIPVVLIGSRLAPPNRHHIEEFLQAIDSHSSVATAILWDGLEPPEEYQRLSRWIASLGKKALVIGTSYQLLSGQPMAKSQTTTFVNIPIDAAEERDKLLTHFAKFLPAHESVLRRYNSGTYKNFFELLYFVTSASRARLVAGIDAEFASHVQSLDTYFAKHIKVADAPLSAFGRALRDAYGDRFDEILRGAGDLNSTTTLQYRSPALRLVESVMVVSSLGLPMPQAIALSLCTSGNTSGFEVYQKAFADFPLIDAFEERGNYFVRARLRLEAEIWTSRRYQSNLEMLDVVLDTASRVKCAEVRRQKSDDLEFVVRLLQTVGSEGPEPYRVPKGYRKIAECVSEIEQRCGRLNPRLLLVKANSLREYVQQDQAAFRNASGRLDYSRLDLETLTRWESCLKEAEDTLSAAEADLMEQLTQSAQARGTRTMLSVVSTEKAATIGGQLICLAAALRMRSRSSDFQRLASTLDRARASWRRSLSIDEENVRATDTACWIIRNVLEECPVAEEQKFTLLAEWNELIVHYSELDLNPDELDKFQVREHEFASALGDRDRLADIFTSSTERGSYAIPALIARGMIAKQGPRAAIDYLCAICGDAVTSERVLLLLYYRLWWQVNSELERYFAEDEVVVAFSVEQWQQLLDLAKARLSLEGESENQLALFHAAWSSLQLGLSKDAQQFLNVLDTISVGNFRRGRALVLLSDSKGDPREFTGEARPGLYSHKGKVWIEDLRIEIPYLTAHFPEATASGTLTGFHVAINYRGAFVQPSSTYNNKRARLKQQQRSRD